MSEKKVHKGDRLELLELIRQLKATVRTLEEGGAGGQGKPDGLAEGIATALGKMVPGLGKIIQTASQSPEFREKLSSIDEEVRRKLKEQPLGRVSSGLTGNMNCRRIGIPPSVRRAGLGRSASGGGGMGPSFASAAPRGKHRGPQPPKVHISPQTPAQLPVDVFAEGDKSVVLAEAPGLDAKDIAVSLEGDELVLAILAPHRKGTQRIKLPCLTTGEPETSLANGILNIHIQKAAQS